MPPRSTREQREALRRTRSYNARQSVHRVREQRRRRDNLVAGIAFVAVVVAAAFVQVAYFTAGPGRATAAATPTASATPSPTPTATVPPASVAEDRTWTGTLTLNDVELGIELDGEAAPQAVANFVTLVRQGFYDGLSCHRLTTAERSRVLQCGDPAGNGTGGPGYSFGPIENAPEDGVYERGVIAMARASEPDSQGSQFFVVYGESEFPGGYTVFGEVTEGLDDLEEAVTSKGVSDTSETPDDGAPAVPVVIQAVEVE